VTQYCRCWSDKPETRVLDWKTQTFKKASPDLLEIEMFETDYNSGFRSWDACRQQMKYSMRSSTLRIFPVMSLMWSLHGWALPLHQSPLTLLSISLISLITVKTSSSVRKILS